MKRVVFLAVLLTAISLQAQETAQPKIAAIVNGETITVDDLDRMYGKLPPQMRENYEASGGKAQFLEQYINKRLLVQEATKQNFTKDEYVAQMLADAREAAIFDLYVKEVVADSIISEADLRAYYEKNKEKYRTVERLKARHIIATPVQQRVMNTTGDNAKNELEARNKIHDLYEKGKPTPQTFGMLAMRFSEDASAPKNGDLGWFTRGTMVAEFEQVAFNMKPGEISGPVKTPYGWHLIYVEDHKPARIATFEEKRREIQEALLAERADKVLAEVNALTQELRRQSRVQINLGNIRD